MPKGTSESGLIPLHSWPFCPGLRCIHFFWRAMNKRLFTQVGHQQQANIAFHWSPDWQTNELLGVTCTAYAWGVTYRNVGDPKQLHHHKVLFHHGVPIQAHLPFLVFLLAPTKTTVALQGIGGSGPNPRCGFYDHLFPLPFNIDLTITVVNCYSCWAKAVPTL